MGVPIYIGRRFIDQPLPPVTRPCHVCQAATSHSVVRHYLTVSVYLFPFLGRTLEYRYTCTGCGARSSGEAPSGAPSMPFLHRMGCLVFMGLPALGLAAYATYSTLEGKWRREAYEAELRAREEATSVAKTAKQEAEAAQKKCFAVVNEALNAATGKTKVLDMKPMAPATPAPLEGAAYVTIKHALSGGIPKPAHKYFGPFACDLEISQLVKDTASGLTGRDHFPTEEARKEAQALLDRARALTPPATLVATDYSCPKRCIGVAAWISVADKKILAVVQVDKSMDHLGYDKDQAELAPLLRQATEAW